MFGDANDAKIIPNDLQLQKLRTKNPSLELIFEMVYVNLNMLKRHYEGQKMLVG